MMQSTFQKYLTSNSSLDVVIFLLLTALAVYTGQSTVFYIIYFFWWNELICILIDKIFKVFVWKTKSNPQETVGPFFLMFIYGVFIIVFFGLIANWKNDEIIIENFKVLLFKNWFFNLNLLYILVITILKYRQLNESKTYFGAFSNNMIILHVSIILGGFMMFFVVKNFPDFFTPENLLGSVLIISPFLLLKLVFHYLALKNKPQS